jgi:stage II sporulation protein AB (anti-sigma F factor)
MTPPASLGSASGPDQPQDAAPAVISGSIAGRSNGMRTLAPLDCSYPSDVSSVCFARAAVNEFAVAAGVAGEQLDDVRLCLSEAVGNAAVHAYPEDEIGAIRVGVIASEGELLVHVSDDGCGLLGGSPNAGLGLGIPLMAELSDGLVVREHGFGGVEVHLRFDLGV